MGKPGRPMKYDYFLLALDKDEVYTPATIVRHGETKGFFENTDDLALARLRVRHTLARFAANHGFPFEGDGYVVLRGQPPIRGWFGWRWLQPLEGR